MHESSVASELMSEADREKVRDQLNRLLETHHFKNSRRYPALLRFIVEETLEGRGEYLKERLLGVRVFDRPADYDTAADPIVRVTIAEIRKRIAQYYHDEEHDSEIRIELLPGHYIPEFRLRTPRAEVQPERTLVAQPAEFPAAVPVPAPPLPAPIEPAALPPARAAVRRYWHLVVAAAAILITLYAVPIVHWVHPSAIDQLWHPLLDSPKPILFCIPTDVSAKRGPMGEPVVDEPAAPNVQGSNAAAPTFLAFESLGQNVVYSDTLAMLRIANVLAVHRREYTVRLTLATNLEDLRQGPTILIGGLDNQWTMRALAPLRFHFAGSDEDRYWIADSTNPANKDWSLDLKVKYAAVTRDYAIIARLHNEQTAQPQMIVAGIGMSGTAAAGEFIADERRVEELRQRIGDRLKDRDFEAVLSTDVVNGIAGAPKIIALSVW